VLPAAQPFTMNGSYSSGTDEVAGPIPCAHPSRLGCVLRHAAAQPLPVHNTKTDVWDGRFDTKPWHTGVLRSCGGRQRGYSNAGGARQKD
jgi:hypothetical protein